MAMIFCRHFPDWDCRYPIWLYSLVKTSCHVPGSNHDSLSGHVAVTEPKQHHEHNWINVAVEHDGKGVGARMRVAEHEEGHKHQP